MPGIERNIKCKRGHDDWIVQADGTYRCRTCRNMRSHVVVAPTKPQKGGALGQKCRRGHDDWDVNENLKKRCAQCRRDWKRHGGYWASVDNRGYEGLGKIHYDTMTRSELLKARGYDAA